jgi:hypothetical protein
VFYCTVAARPVGGEGRFVFANVYSPISQAPDADLGTHPDPHEPETPVFTGAVTFKGVTLRVVRLVAAPYAEELLLAIV